MARYIDVDFLIGVMGSNDSITKREILALAENFMADVQEVKHGHWIRWYEEQKNEYGEIFTPHYKCSECNKEFDITSSFSMETCPHCSAKMDEEVE